MPRSSATRVRCPWAKAANPLYVRYHDEEWGVAAHDDRHLFEMLVLEGAQAGLSWETILNKREAYRAAFDNFDPRRVAKYDARKVAALLANSGIVRNRLKVASAIGNASAFLAVQDEFGSFDTYLWRWVEGRPVRNAWESLRDVPPKTPLSDAISKDLRRRGFNFVGSTILYAYLQAVGLVNDHITGCFRYRAVNRRRA